MTRILLAFLAMCTSLCVHAQELVVRGGPPFLPIEVQGTEAVAARDSAAGWTILEQPFAPDCRIHLPVLAPAGSTDIAPGLSITGVTFRHLKAHVPESLQGPASGGVGLLRNFPTLTSFPGRKVRSRESESGAARPVDVMVVATMHGGHADNPRYSYEDLYSLAAAFEPDLVGTEIRQEDLPRSEEYLARNHPLEMRELARRFEDRIIGIDWLGEDLQGRPVPEGYWREQSDITRLQRLLAQDDAFRSPKVEEAQARQREILETATAAALNDGRYDLATAAYYRALAEHLEGSQYERLSEFYAERDRRIARNAIAAVSRFMRANPGGGGRILFAVGADHRWPLVEALRRRFGGDIRLVAVP
ncbi:MAG: hypothetical protein V2I39_01555 [Erythrobacter sp.]|jgi:hypothetical protein|nr:hypothetical protein [Erythrobacter sp.]